MPFYTGAGTFSGFEYTIIPDGGPATPEDAVFSHGSNPPYSFAQIEIDFPDRTIITGHRIEVRYYELEITEVPPPTDPETGEPVGEPTYNTNLTYPAWNLTHQEMQRGLPRLYFERETGNNLYSAPPGTYGPAPAVAGISDTIYGPPPPPFPEVDLDHPDYEPQPDVNAYSYCRIFDQAEVDWYPRLSSADQPPLNGRDAIVPSTPYDPERVPPLYPFDAILGFVPDDREIVTVTYTLLTESDKGNETITISHPVSQGDIDVAEKMKLFIEKSYYGNDIIHTGLYPPDIGRVFDRRGRNIYKEDVGAPLPHYSPDRSIKYRVRNEPLSMTQLTRRTYPYDESIQDWRPYPEEVCMDSQPRTSPPLSSEPTGGQE